MRASAQSVRGPRRSTLSGIAKKLLENNGITIEPIDLSEIFGRVERMKDNGAAAQAKLASVKGYVSTQGIPEAALLKWPSSAQWSTRG